MIIFRGAVSLLIGIVNVRGRSKIVILTLAAVLAYFSLSSIVYGQIKGSTNLIYNTSNSGAADQFGHVYSLNYGETLSEALSYHMGLNAIFNSQQGERTTQSLTPFFFMKMNAYDFSGSSGFLSSYTEDLKGEAIISNNLFISLEPHMLEKYIHYTIHYNHRSTYDDSFPRRLDFNGDSWRFSLNHVLPVPLLNDVSFAYTLNQDTSLNEITGEKVNNLDGNLGIGFSRGIMDMANISGSLSLQGERTRFSVPQPPILTVFTPFGLFALDPTPTTGSLANFSSLVDGDIDTSTGISLQNLNNNIGADLGSSRQTSLVFIDMVPGFVDPSGEVLWEVYRSDDGVNWVLVTNNPNVFFNVFQSRYEIEFAVQSTRFIKVVNTTASTELNADVTEIEVFSLITGLTQVSKTSRKLLGSDLRFSSRITDDLSLSASTSYSVDKSDPQDIQSSRAILNGGVSYSPSKYFHASLNTSRNSSRESSLSDTTTHVNSSYNLTFNTQLLEIVRPSVSLSLSDSHENELLESRTKSGAINLFFLDELFPGIDLGLNGDISQIEDFEQGSESFNYGSGFQLNLRPKYWLTLTNRYAVSWSRSKIGSGGGILTKDVDAGSGISLAPSPLFHLSLDFDWTEGGILSAFRVNWLQTDKLQISLGYVSRSGEQLVSDVLDANVNWKIRRNLSLSASWRFGFEPGAQETAKSFNLNLFATF